MSLPYENATTGDKAIGEINRILSQFGCTGFGHWTDTEKGEVRVQFVYRGRNVSVSASWRGYAAAWLRQHPYSSRMRKTWIDHERAATEQAKISVYSMLRDWIKGQVTAVAVGMLSFEGAFLGQIILPSGETILDRITSEKMLPALPAHEGKA